MRVRSVFFLAVLCGATTLVLAASPAVAAPPTNVHISGEVTLAPGFSVQLTANAKGTPDSLSGQGVDSTFHGVGPPPGTCTFDNLTGSISGTVVTLHGSVTQSSDKSLIGTPVWIEADASTGAISFNFGGFILTGTGNVHIA